MYEFGGMTLSIKVVPSVRVDVACAFQRLPAWPDAVARAVVVAKSFAAFPITSAVPPVFPVNRAETNLGEVLAFGVLNEQTVDVEVLEKAL